MVLSGTKMTSSLSSIVNTNQGGGSKKAGTPPLVGLTSWGYVAYAERGDGNLSLMNMKVNRFKMFPNQNTPIGTRTTIRMY